MAKKQGSAGEKKSKRPRKNSEPKMTKCTRCLTPVVVDEFLANDFLCPHCARTPETFPFGSNRAERAKTATPYTPREEQFAWQKSRLTQH